MSKILIEKDDLEVMLGALTDAVRYANLSHSKFDRDKYFSLHCNLVNRLYKSGEMRDKQYMPLSIKDGVDLGTIYTLENIKEQAEIGQE